MSTREQNLLGAVGILILVVGLLVFPYTQALRHVNYQRELYLKLKEQIAAGKAELRREGVPDLDRLRESLLGSWEGSLPTREGLAAWGQRFESYGRNEFAIGSLQAKVGSVPEKTVKVPVDEKMSVDLELYPLELEGLSTTRNLVSFLESVKRADLKLLYTLVSLDLKIADPAKVSAVGFRVKWLVATRPLSSNKKGSPAADFKVPERVVVPWGDREEPFLSVFVRPDMVKTSPKLLERYRLTAITWDLANPTCIMDGAVRQPGDWVQGSRLVLIAPTGVIVEKGGEEFFLPLPGALSP